jgi:hypothetical protein
MNLHELYFTLRPEDIAYVKFVLESYDGVGIIRTVDRRRAVIVALVVEDFLATARQLFASLTARSTSSKSPARRNRRRLADAGACGRRLTPLQTAPDFRHT